ncbi:sperm acrosome membrane-associated protein 6 [Acipenser oxyrinchus oxyrinchus]|uniref:Sperm acrosome membrane-associated protein 6 n=1 Tax=Acipenser oxyrinchus oxyrinchus TaxID=40147 RepID=A0AAD8CIA7_ACIOX|nr:sperm acrosome membrane-associated protein 6 [Acipenser oxyrinchus oxyrinchus]
MRWKLLSVSLLLSLLSSPLSSACYFCLIDKNLTDTLCTGYKLPESSVQSYDECFNSVRRVFLEDRSVAAAGRVGRGYEEQLKRILNRLIAEVISVTRGVVSTVNRYTYLLTTAADQFKSEAWKLPRASGCIPPCGYQKSGAVYNCVTCKYDGCGFPLDCPIVERTVHEKNRTALECSVDFEIPRDAQFNWNYVKEVKTNSLNLFKVVTSGSDRWFTILRTRRSQQGTYMCEIFDQEKSIVRLFFFLRVISKNQIAEAELQELFDSSLHSDWEGAEAEAEAEAATEATSLSRLTSAIDFLLTPGNLSQDVFIYITVCVSALLLLPLLCTGIVYWWATKT